MSWQEQINGDPLGWLLEQDDQTVRYNALKDLVGLPADDPELAEAREQAHIAGPIAALVSIPVLAPAYPSSSAAGFWKLPSMNSCMPSVS